MARSAKSPGGRVSEKPSIPFFAMASTGIPFSRRIARASSAYRRVVFSIALSISTARRRNTPPWRSSPRWIFGLFSFQTTGRLSVRLGRAGVVGAAGRAGPMAARGGTNYLRDGTLAGPRVGGGRLLARPSDGAARHFHLDLVRDLEGHRRVRQPRDGPVQAAGGDHPVAQLEVPDEILVLSRRPLLGADEK